jgi:hypothetical protein
MTTRNQTVDNMVQSMRHIRDEISNEIKDMTFAEERAFLDKLLKNEKSNSSNQRRVNKKSASDKLKV